MTWATLARLIDAALSANLIVQKLYGYEDENGVETKGQMFTVAIVVLDGDPGRPE